jgi:hypothetical protein
MVKAFARQQTWQSSVYCWCLPADGSTVVSFLALQNAHVNVCEINIVPDHGRTPSCFQGAFNFLPDANSG